MGCIDDARAGATRRYKFILYSIFYSIHSTCVVPLESTGEQHRDLEAHSLEIRRHVIMNVFNGDDLVLVGN